MFDHTQAEETSPKEAATEAVYLQQVLCTVAHIRECGRRAGSASAYLTRRLSRCALLSTGWIPDRRFLKHCHHER
jgi:hypothetical protein